MSTFTPITKNISTFTNQSKSGSDVVGYIVTPDLFYILVGENSNQRLAWSIPGAWVNQLKN